MSLSSVSGNAAADALALLRRYYSTNQAGGAGPASTDPTAASSSPAASSGAPSVTGSTTNPLSSSTLTFVISVQEQASNDPASASGPDGGPGQLFAKLDANRDAQLTQSELEQAVTAAGGTTSEAGSLFSQLDKSGSGSVSAADFSSAVHGHGHHHGHHHAQGADEAAATGSQAPASDPLAALLGTSSTSTTPGDGSATAAAAQPVAVPA